jgi:hypothetical protein
MIKNLHAPFPPNEIEWRVGSTKADKSSGLALAYITARHVMERLDDVCGPENWQDRYEFHGKRTICYLSIRINDEWVTKADGAGDSDVEAEKGAISDALKRAAVKWGMGRYLYGLGNTWVDIEPAGRSFRIKKSEFPRLEKMLADRFGLPPSDLGNVNEAAAELDSEITPTLAPIQEPSTYPAHLSAIINAASLDDLRAAFTAAQKNKTLTKGELDDLITAKDARKAELAAPNFDNMDTGR